MQEEIQNTYEFIKQGSIILYPTDKVWGIGYDATNVEAVAKIYKLKQRGEVQSMIVLINWKKMICNVFKDIREVTWQLIYLSEKSTTIIIDNPRTIASNLISQDNFKKNHT